jgi:putative FmdB family regulatory protein
MPLYEYRCNKCGLVFEIRARFWGKEICPGCPRCLDATDDDIIKLVSLPAKGIVK